MRKLTTQEFIEKARQVHGEKYDYAEVEYVNNSTKVKLTCDSGHSFEQRPSCHLGGQGCRKCFKSTPRTLTTEQFVAKAKSVHKDAYAYDAVLYVSTKTHVEITCKRCNYTFQQRPVDHLAGSGCHRCQLCGFRKDLPGYLYVFSDDEVTKVGITNRSPSVRLKEVVRSSGRKFTERFHIYLDDGSKIKDTEASILKWLRATYSQLKEAAYDGSTESFTGVDLDTLVRQITLILPEGK